jgi:DivIVA domain-containing protein
MAEEDRERAETASAERTQAAPLPARSESVRPEVPAEIRDVSFHRAAGGYARREVDRYVERVNGLIAELEITRSPESAIKHAFAQVGEQTSGILQQAGETADQITQAAQADAEATVARARSEASGIVAEARGEAEGIVERATAQAKVLRRRADEELRKLRAETDAIRAERRQLLEGIEELAARLKRLGDAAAEGVEPEPTGDDRPSDSA